MSGDQGTARRVVVTGIGVFSPVGVGTNAFAESLKTGKSGIAVLRSLSYSAAPSNAGGEVSEFDDSSAKKEYLRPLRKSLKIMCREIQLGAASAIQALDQSGLDLQGIDHQRLGVEFGAGQMFSPPEVLAEPCWVCTDAGEGDDPQHTFDFQRWGNSGENAETDSGMAHMEPLWLLRYLPNMPGCHIGIYASACGPNNSITQAEASANLALAEALRVIQRGAADVMITGATGTRIHPVNTLHAAVGDQLAHGEGDPATWCRPFDLHRNGQVLSEAACTLILEEETHAKARGAEIFGTLLGTGASCVVDTAGRADTRRALAQSMRAALAQADLAPDEIGHINAHGLGETDMDREEAAAIRDVFGDSAGKIPVTALKSSLGNCSAGCGSLELAGSLVGLKAGFVPPTLNYGTPDPDCPLNVVHGEPLRVDNKVVLSVNVTRMGQAAAVIVAGA